MISTIYNVPLKQNGEEMLQRGTRLFPCSAYRGDIRRYAAEHLPVHWHRELEMFVLDEGKVQITTGRDEFVLHAGDGYFINTGTLHGIYTETEQPCLFHSLVFDATLISGYEGSVYDLNYIRPFLEKGAAIIPLYRKETGDAPFLEFEEAFVLCAKEPQDYEFGVRTHLSRLFLALWQAVPFCPESRISAQDQRIKKMLRWIGAHYEETVSADQIAASAGVSVRECQRIFRKIVHRTPMQYLMNYRITMAAGLLKNTEETVTQIAATCGFDSVSYFSKQFRALLGKTPTQYRRECGEMRN